MSLTVLGIPGLHCSIRRQFPVELEWRPSRRVAGGDTVELRVGRMRALAQWRLARIEFPGARVLWRWPRFPAVHSYFSNKERCWLKAALPEGAEAGAPLALRLLLIPGVFAGVDLELSMWLGEGAGPAEPDPGAECALVAAAGPVERLSVYGRPVADARGRVRTAIVPEDRYGNPAAFVREIAVKVEWEGVERALALRTRCLTELPSPKGVARCRVAVPLKALDASENIANAEYRDGCAVVTGNPVWGGGVAGLLPAFGEFHWHSEFSADGARSYEAALLSGRDDLNLDFISSGDHNPKAEAWQRTTQLLDRYNRDGEFATFYGWEDGSRLGHQNYYFLRPDHPAVCGGSAGALKGGPNQNNARIAEMEDLLAVPHHTNADAETRRPEDDTPVWLPYPWAAPVKPLRLVEIAQVRGNQEANDYADAWRGWHQRNDASFQDALAKGHRVGMTGGTDNHCGWPGRIWSHEEGGPTTEKSVILTGAWTERIERGSVFKALYARRTWAAWDTRGIVWFEVNGAPMGAETALPAGTPLTARVLISAESPLRTIEIVSEGAVVWQASAADRDVDLRIPLGAARSTHFYLRVLERAGGILYASPVFVTAT
jgi:hypothetical protein